jgi:trk system potassium uptake protein
MRFTDILDFLAGLFVHKPRNTGEKRLPVRAQEFAVIGLGRFGSSLATTLVSLGHTVLGVERDQALAQQWADEITQTLSLDSTDEDALRDIDITSYQTVVVAIGTNFEANVMTTVALKELGVRNVVCKAATLRQRDILLKVGADRVVLPEHESGARLAQELATPGILDTIKLTEESTISELRVPRKLSGKTLAQARVESEYGLHVAAALREKVITVCPSGDFKLQEDDLLVVLGKNQDIVRLLID